MERAVQDQLIRNGAGSRHPGKYKPSISTLGLEQWRWVGVGLEKRLDSGQVRAYPCLSSERELHIHPNSQRCRLLPPLAALRRRRRRHPRPRTEFHIRTHRCPKNKKLSTPLLKAVANSRAFVCIQGYCWLCESSMDG